MGQHTPTDRALYEDAIELGPAIEALSALLEGGIASLPAGLRKSFQRDDYATALAIARERYRVEDPNSHQAALVYATLLTQRGLCDEAAGVLRKALAGHERDVPLQLAQALNLLAQDDGQAAAWGLLQGLEHVSAQEGRWWGLMGSIYLEMDAIEEAMRCYERALELGVQEPEVAYRLARLLWEDERRFDGASFMERAARLAVQDARLWALAGEAWGEAEEWKRSSEAWARAVKLESDEEAWWMGYGRSLKEERDLRGAVRAFERALRLDPFLVEAQVELSHSQLDLGFLEEAMQGYRKVLKESPDRIDALAGASAAAFEQGDLEEAERYARQVIEQDDEGAAGHYNLGLVLLELGRAQEAWEALRAAHEREAIGLHAIRLALAEVERAEYDEALRLCRAVSEEWEELGGELAEVAQALVRRGADGLATELMEEGREMDEPVWALVSTALRYIVEARGAGEPAALAAVAARFDKVSVQHAEALPLVMGLDGLERAAQRLKGPAREVARAMARRLARG